MCSTCSGHRRHAPAAAGRILENDRAQQLPDDPVEAARRPEPDTAAVRAGRVAGAGGRGDGPAGADRGDRGSTAWCAMIGPAATSRRQPARVRGAQGVGRSRPGQRQHVRPGRPADRWARTAPPGRAVPVRRQRPAQRVDRAGGYVHGPDGLDPRLRIVWVETCSLTVKRAWDTSGLRGTGSPRRRGGRTGRRRTRGAVALATRMQTLHCGSADQMARASSVKMASSRWPDWMSSPSS